MAVTKVEYGGALPQETGISTAFAAPRLAASLAAQSSGWTWRADSAERRARYQRLAQPLAASLNRALDRFSQALGRFQWPADTSPLCSARLVTAASDPGNAASLTVLAAGQATSQHKLLSLARAPDASTALAAADAATTYVLTLTQGGESRQVTVTVPAGAGWKGVLNAVARAINATDLPVQATVVRQTYPGQQLPGVSKVGMFLDLSVNPAHADQDIALEDASGHLALGLQLAAVEVPTGAAAATRYDLRVDRVAKASSLVTAVQDPGAASGLDAGEYQLAYAAGDASGVVTVGVDAGMTWGEVLGRAADAINSSTDLLAAEVKDAPRVSGLDRSDAYWTDGAYLEVALASPKLGQRLSLTQEGSDWLGLQPTANPGADAQVQVNGQTLTSETGVFSLDQGRVLLSAQQAAGEPVAAAVAEAGDEMAARLSDVVAAYNDLSALLSANADLLDADFPAGFRDPLADLAPSLGGLGLSSHADATLSFDDSGFLESFSSDPDRTGALLLDRDSGLLARWGQAVASAQKGGAAKALLPPTLLADLGPPAETELRLEESGRLLDVLESSVAAPAAVTASSTASASAASGLSGLLGAARTLSGLATAKRSALAASLPAEGPARLLKLEG